MDIKETTDMFKCNKWISRRGSLNIMTIRVFEVSDDNRVGEACSSNRMPGCVTCSHNVSVSVCVR